MLSKVTVICHDGDPVIPSCDIPGTLHGIAHSCGELQAASSTDSTRLGSPGRTQGGKGWFHSNSLSSTLGLMSNIADNIEVKQ